MNLYSTKMIAWAITQNNRATESTEIHKQQKEKDANSIII